MLPPHPAAMLAVTAYKADVGTTILYGLLVGLPTAALAGPIYASWIAPRIILPPDNPIADQLGGETTQEMPTFGISIFTALVPVILILLATAADFFLADSSTLRSVLHFVGTPPDANQHAVNAVRDLRRVIDVGQR